MRANATQNTDSSATSDKVVMSNIATIFCYLQPSTGQSLTREAMRRGHVKGKQLFSFFNASWVLTFLGSVAFLFCSSPAKLEGYSIASFKVKGV